MNCRTLHAFILFGVLLSISRLADADDRIPIVVGEENFSVAVEFRFPSGYLISDEAPSEVSLQFESPADGRLTDTTLKLGDGLKDHAVAVAQGSLKADEAELEITGRLYYCATNSRLCHVHVLSERRLVLRTEGAGDRARISVDIRPRVPMTPGPHAPLP